MHPNPNILSRTEIDRERFVRSGEHVTISIPGTVSIEDASEIATAVNDAFQAREARLDRVTGGDYVLRLVAGYTADVYVINGHLANLADYYGLAEVTWTHSRPQRVTAEDGVLA